MFAAKNPKIRIFTDQKNVTLLPEAGKIFFPPSHSKSTVRILILGFSAGKIVY